MEACRGRGPRKQRGQKLSITGIERECMIINKDHFLKLRFQIQNTRQASGMIGRRQEERQRNLRILWVSLELYEEMQRGEQYIIEKDEFQRCLRGVMGWYAFGWHWVYVEQVSTSHSAFDTINQIRFSIPTRTVSQPIYTNSIWIYIRASLSFGIVAHLFYSTCRGVVAIAQLGMGLWLLVKVLRILVLPLEVEISAADERIDSHPNHHYQKPALQSLQSLLWLHEHLPVANIQNHRFGNLSVYLYLECYSRVQEFLYLVQPVKSILDRRIPCIPYMKRHYKRKVRQIVAYMGRNHYFSDAAISGILSTVVLGRMHMKLDCVVALDHGSVYVD